ncbi:hypothetical protein LCGC14_2858530, partial [marine sediment metagenome]
MKTSNLTINTNKPRSLLPHIAPVLALSCVSTLALAFDGPNTDYSTDRQHYRVWDEALEPVELVNSILCFTAQMRANDFVNAGPYVELVDDSQCFDDEDDSGDTAQSSGASNQPSFMEVVVDATRASDTSPVEVAVWIPGMGAGDDGEQAIKFKAVVSAGPSA